MEQRTLGKSGIRASRIGLGCTTFGREIPEEAACRIMDYAAERDMTEFDTAAAYGGETIDMVLLGARNTGHPDNALAALDQPFAADWMAETQSWT
jgi:predicted aldo/keto reductase-like oxidoreductase